MGQVRRHEWLPLIVTLILGAITLFAYSMTAEALNPVVYVQVSCTACVPAILPLWGRLTRRPFPVTLNAMIAFHMILASFLGSAMQWYRTVSWWDLLMHGLFGLVGSAVVYVLILRWGGEGLHRGGRLFLVGLSVMGCGALWEIFEFISDALLDADAQRVKEALRLGTSPIADTMTDLIITMVGIAVFIVLELLWHRRQKTS